MKLLIFILIFYEFYFRKYDSILVLYPGMTWMLPWGKNVFIIDTTVWSWGNVTKEMYKNPPKKSSEIIEIRFGTFWYRQ